MNVEITLGSNTFKAEGETLEINDSLVSLFRVWVNAQGLGGAVSLEESTEKLEQNTAALEQAVAANTPAQ